MGEKESMAVGREAASGMATGRVAAPRDVMTGQSSGRTANLAGGSGGPQATGPVRLDPTPARMADDDGDDLSGDERRNLSFALERQHGG